MYLEGEGYFEVAKDTAKPFIVEAKEVDVRVLGTSFNVSAYVAEQAIRTTLVSGKVRVGDRLTGKGEVILPGATSGMERRNFYDKRGRHVYLYRLDRREILFRGSHVGGNHGTTRTLV